MQTIWKDIPEHEWKYKASTDWEIFSYGYWLLKQERLDNWYRRVYIFWKRIMVHTLILLTFVWKDETKSESNHKNGIRHDNRLENLEWCTHSENCLHRSRELWKCKEQPKKRKPVSQFDIDGNLLKRWDSMVSIYAHFWKKIDVWACCNGKIKTCYGYIWKYTE